MRYWIMVILEESMSCESCGRMLGYGQVAFVFKDDLAKDSHVRCRKCTSNAFPEVAEALKD